MTTAKGKTTVAIQFMGKSFTFSRASLIAKCKQAGKKFPPPNASHLKHNVSLPRECAQADPVSLYWIANNIFDTPSVSISKKTGTLRGSFNPAQVAKQVLKLAALGTVLHFTESDNTVKVLYGKTGLAVKIKAPARKTKAKKAVA